MQGLVGEGSRRRLLVPLLTARAPWTAAHCFHGGIRAKLWRGAAPVMVEERAGDVARCGKGKDFSPVDGRADDVESSCCVVMHRGDLVHRVVGPVHEDAAQASNAVCDVGNVVVMVLDFPTNLACRRSAQRGLEQAAGTRPWCWVARRRAGCGHESPHGGPGTPD